MSALRNVSVIVLALGLHYVIRGDERGSQFFAYQVAFILVGGGMLGFVWSLHASATASNDEHSEPFLPREGFMELIRADEIPSTEFAAAIQSRDTSLWGSHGDVDRANVPDISLPFASPSHWSLRIGRFIVGVIVKFLMVALLLMGSLVLANLMTWLGGQ